MARRWEIKVGLLGHQCGVKVDGVEILPEKLKFFGVRDGSYVAVFLSGGRPSKIVKGVVGVEDGAELLLQYIPIVNDHSPRELPHKGDTVVFTGDLEDEYQLGFVKEEVALKIFDADLF